MSADTVLVGLAALALAAAAISVATSRKRLHDRPKGRRGRSAGSTGRPDRSPR